MKTLDFNAMENVQGGAGLPIGLPDLGSLAALVFGLVNSLLGTAESLVTGLLSSINGITGGLGGL